MYTQGVFMPVVKVSEEITQYISKEDFERLLSNPSITERDINFKETKSLKALLSEFGY